tara:strand:+ start:9037 stop:9273 length:237 start_codon:yes stop_codon:yes gene_type:complete
MAIDLTYLTTGFFTTFFPESKEGEAAYKEMIEQNESPKILTRDLKNVLHQLRKAGYSVKKAKKPTQSIDDILSELDQL